MLDFLGVSDPEWFGRWHEALPDEDSFRWGLLDGFTEESDQAGVKGREAVET